MNSTLYQEDSLSAELPTADTEHQALDALMGHKYITLTTFRRNSEAVTTPVWFAQDGGRLYVTTARESGKVKRICNRPDVEVAPSSATGKERGPRLDAHARILPPSEEERAAPLLREKYSWALRITEWLWRLLDREHIYLEIVPVQRES